MSMLRGEFLTKYGPWAVVTGASEGIGAAFATQLAEMGMNLVLVARREDRLIQLAETLRKQFQVAVHVAPTDLSDSRDLRELLEDLSELDVGLLIAAAGYGSSGPALLSHEVTEAEMIDVNCRAVLQQVIFFGKKMTRRGGGGMVLLSSVVAFQGTPYSANYAATKAYVQSLAEGVGVELKKEGIDVLSVAPGPISSGFAARADMNLGKTMTPDVVARVSLAALGRWRTVRPGWLSKLLGWGLSTAPRWIRVQIMGSIMHGMTAHQKSKAPRKDVAD